MVTSTVVNLSGKTFFFLLLEEEGLGSTIMTSILSVNIDPKAVAQSVDGWLKGF